MKVYLPNSAFIGNFEKFARPFQPSNPAKLKVEFHPKWTSLHPLALSMTTALALDVKRRGGKIVCNLPSKRAVSTNYLQRMGLLHHLGLKKTTLKEHEPTGRFIPLTLIQSSDDLRTFLEEMVPLLHAPPERVWAIEYALSELIRNVLEHSQSPIGAVACAQRFPKSNRIGIGVADVGVGIRETIKEAYTPGDDLDAIQLALLPGITGKTRLIGGDDFNAGAGLFFTKSIAKVNRELFLIYSGQGMYKLLKEKPTKKVVLCTDPFDDKNSHYRDMPAWPGTAVGIDISLDPPPTSAKLFDLIRQAYQLDIKKRKKQHFKRPRFI